MLLDDADVAGLRGRIEELSVVDVEEVYLPLARLLRLRFEAARQLAHAQARFLGHRRHQVPFIVGLAGSVAVGKSTTARVLQQLLIRGVGKLEVVVVTTDGFLWSNAELERRGLLRRKGFPESYDQRGLLAFVHDLKCGEPEVRCPVYSHQAYDVVPDEQLVLRQPDVVFVEGLNVLQTASSGTFVSDYFDFRIYVDADISALERWYVDRFLALRDTAFRDPNAYFHRYAGLDDAEAQKTALSFWHGINRVNLEQNILPTRERADLILEKSSDHRIRKVRLRKA